MAGRGLSGRVDSLEHKINPAGGAPVYIVLDYSESEHQARQRWEERHGPLDRSASVVLIKTGVPRFRGGICA